MAGRDIRAMEAAEEARWAAKMEAEEERLREACNRVSFKAIAHLEAGYGEARKLLEMAIENAESVELSAKEKHRALLEFARSFNRMLDVSSRIVSVAIARTKRPEREDERAGWMELVDELKAGQKALPAPKEIVVKPQKVKAHG